MIEKNKMTKEDSGSQEELDKRAIENEDYLNILKNLGNDIREII